MLESPDFDKRAKSYTKTKIGSGIVIRKIADLIREKEKTTNAEYFFLFFGTENEARRTSGGGIVVGGGGAHGSRRG